MEILEVTTQDSGGQVTVSLKGELDLSSVGKVEEELARVEADDPSVLVLDLSQLSFLDSTGLRAVVTADERARSNGRRLVIVRGPDPVQRVFAITRLEDRLEMVDDAQAVTEL
jgi:anti-anti-sigma factor